MKFIALFLSALVAGCGTKSKAPSLNDWVNSPALVLSSVWGSPSSVLQLSNGEKILIYHTSTTAQTEENTYNHGMARSREISELTYICSVAFTIGSNGTILKWNHEGNDDCIQPK